MTGLARFPKCASYLRAVDKKALTDPGMNTYWAAVILADALPERDLEAAGFEWPQGVSDGDVILSQLEAVLANRRVSVPISGAVRESVKAFLGSRGVMASRLKDDAEFWEAARILWPDQIGEGAGLNELHSQLKAMSKKQRQRADVQLLRQRRPRLFRDLEFSGRAA